MEQTRPPVTFYEVKSTQSLCRNIPDKIETFVNNKLTRLHKQNQANNRKGNFHDAGWWLSKIGDDLNVSKSRSQLIGWKCFCNVLSCVFFFLRSETLRSCTTIFKPLSPVSRRQFNRRTADWDAFICNQPSMGRILAMGCDSMNFHRVDWEGEIKDAGNIRSNGE